ncbi:hypothetical protein SNOUR_06140 [Streptomyces noursei ATCC 11455]|uniref:hypothetical protein n=1 Tax=Streptomyces noursei TaxID=1971 RepID=UPI00081CA78A|nr:hypothetical protein SNOUR_06140 [Streptomyces noursei ATCC 11455]
MTADAVPAPPLVLLSGDPLRPRRTDPQFAAEAAEAAAARAAGAATAVLDHEALLAGDAERAVSRVPRAAGPVWYRG